MAVELPERILAQARAADGRCGIRIRYELFPVKDGMPEFDSPNHFGITETILSPTELSELVKTCY